MHSSAVSNSASADKNGDKPGKKVRKFLFRKLWLPRAVYEALPYFYILAGLTTLISGIYLPDETWMLPYVVLLGLVCLHAGLAVATLRYRYSHRRQKEQSDINSHNQSSNQ